MQKADKIYSVHVVIGLVLMFGVGFCRRSVWSRQWGCAVRDIFGTYLFVVDLRYFVAEPFGTDRSGAQ